MPIMKWTLALAMATALGLPAGAEPFRSERGSMENESWYELNVDPGRVLVVERHKGLGGKIKGRFVGSDELGVTLDTKRGVRTTIPWAGVRKIKAKRDRRGLWMGMAAGAALAGAVLVADSELDAIWAAAWIAHGAGTLGAVGSTLDRAQGPLYEAPQAEDPGP